MKIRLQTCLVSSLPDYCIFLCMLLFPSVVVYMYFLFMNLFNFYFLANYTYFSVRYSANFNRLRPRVRQNRGGHLCHATRMLLGCAT